MVYLCVTLTPILEDRYVKQFSPEPMANIWQDQSSSTAVLSQWISTFLHVCLCGFTAVVLLKVVQRSIVPCTKSQKLKNHVSILRDLYVSCVFCFFFFFLEGRLLQIKFYEEVYFRYILNSDKV
jgi:hypothetical protein